MTLIKTSSGKGVIREKIHPKKKKKRFSAMPLIHSHRQLHSTGGKCAYIITCGPGILQRAVLRAETQSRAVIQPTQEEHGRALPRN